MGTSEGARKGHTPESDAKRQASMKARWEDPEYRAKRAALEETPGMKVARSEAMQIANSDPEKRRQHSEFMKNRFATNEEYRAQQKAWITKAAQNPAVQDARSESMKRAWLEHPELFVNSLKATLKAAQSPEGRERQRWSYARRAAAAPCTPYEHAVTLVLNEMEIPHNPHAVREGKEMDIYIPSHKLNIEVDGVNHAGRGSLRDKKRDIYLTERGYQVLRIKHRNILNGSFITKLQEVLK